MNDAIQAELDRIYQGTDTVDQQAAEQDTDAADDESAAEVDETAADDAAEESTEESTEESGDDQEESSDETADEAEPTDAEESASFDDLLDPIPSNDALLARNPRIPQTTKDEIVTLADGWRKDHELLNRIGGEQGATILQPISELLGKSTREFDDHLKAIGAMISTNPMATTELLTEGAIGVLFNTAADPAAREFQKAGDAVLQKRFGDGVTSQFIEKAVMLKNAGLDFDSEIEDIRNQGTSSTLFENLSTENNTLKEQVQELRNLVENPHLIERQTAQQTDAVKALDDEIVSRFSEGISPFRERVRWQAESPLTKVVASALLAELKNEPEYKEAVNFVKQYGTLKQGDVIPYNIEKELYKLINKGKGRFGTTAIEINKELRGLTATSRNAQVEKKVKETTKPKAVPVTPQKSYSNLTSFAGANDPVKAELERIYAEADRQRAA